MVRGMVFRMDCKRRSLMLCTGSLITGRPSTVVQVLIRFAFVLLTDLGSFGFMADVLEMGNK